MPNSFRKIVITYHLLGTDSVQLRHYVFDISDEGALERALQGCTAVVHCAHAPIPWKYQNKKETEEMWRDNLTSKLFPFTLLQKSRLPWYFALVQSKIEIVHSFLLWSL
ncbi:unnamed protein product [Strongylus vulgaris]|uniref:3-beta hydroxysteroid dehydrogenase/isomerase domain-containing protein n=1 Tax=Strongylus vulgaris TaxID=40348 RepID=A0A3P7KF77_STRVU|nr:unnamed protein product [Strongylus vulgaris]